MGFWNGVQDFSINALDDGLTNGLKAMTERRTQRNKAGNKMNAEDNNSSLMSGAIFAGTVVAKFLINKYKKEKI